VKAAHGANQSSVGLFRGIKRKRAILPVGPSRGECRDDMRDDHNRGALPPFSHITYTAPMDSANFRGNAHDGDWEIMPEPVTLALAHSTCDPDPWGKRTSSCVPCVTGG